MIAVLTAIVYIVSIVDETFNNKNVQKGTAISRIDTEDGYQVYKFIAYTPENDLMDADNTSCEVTQRLQQNKLYQISGKFAPLKDNSFNIIITTSIQLQMDEDNTPISKPVAHLIGNTPTDPPTNRSRAIRPVSLMLENEDDPYWKDAIEKYFARPNAEIFETMTYTEYFKNFRISTKNATSKNKEIYRDNLNNYVIQRNSPIIVRYRYLKLQDGEVFFYQQLLLTIPCRSEEELLGNYSSYREKYLTIYPEFQNILEQHTNTSQDRHHYVFQTQLNFIIGNN